MTVFIITLCIVIFDQATKYLAERFLRPVGEVPIIKDFLYLTYHRNKGAAFSILQNHRWLFMVLSSAIIVGIIMYLAFTRKQKKSRLLNVSLALLLGGGIGNMIDRIFFGEKLFCGSVIDFIDFRFINFAVFNVADSAVTIGEILLIIYIIFFEAKKKDN